MKIGVMGAGAIGCYVGGRLAAAQVAEVTLVGREALGREIAAHGLTVREMRGEARIPSSAVKFSEDVEALSDVDVVLCCVKAGATTAAAESLARVLHPGTVVVSLQNGVRNADVLRERLNECRVVGGIVMFNVVRRESALFERTTSGELTVETTAGGEDARWVEALRSASLVVREQTPLAPELWTKLVMNLNNAVNALSGVPVRQMILSRGYRRVVAMLLDEALTVLTAAGIAPAKFRGAPLPVMSFIMRLPTPIVRMVIGAQLRIDPTARSSMWQDLERGRTTEIDYLNGEIVCLARAHGTVAPLNERIVELVHEVEKTKAGSPGLSPEALIAELGR